jgi:hypothetical protein
MSDEKISVGAIHGRIVIDDRLSGSLNAISSLMQSTGTTAAKAAAAINAFGSAFGTSLASVVSAARAHEDDRVRFERLARILEDDGDDRHEDEDEDCSSHRSIRLPD